LITTTKSKETRNNILTEDIFKNLIPTFGLLQWVNLIKECLPKVDSLAILEVKVMERSIKKNHHPNE